MDVESIYSDLPEDPQLAFAQLEREFRRRLFDKLEHVQGDTTHLYLEYINHTLASANELEIEQFSGYEIPNRNAIYETYEGFSTHVDHFLVQLQIRNSRRLRKHSVALDSATKQKIRKYLTKIKVITDTLDVEDRKREAIYARISDLEAEIDRDRTRYEALASLVIETAGLSGEVAKKLEPFRQWIEPIAALMGRAKDAEQDAPRLPAPPKALSPPRRERSSPAKVANDPDEIPF